MDRPIRSIPRPIDTVLPELKQALQDNRIGVLIAQPGAGKTTHVPMALLAESWLERRRILMLEPRRLAARAAARYMASLLGEQVGETVGYRVKRETRVSRMTRIEVITEGVLTRMLQSDPALEDAGLVIFDEFHERNLNADLGLTLCLQSQALLREDLRILIMSATLDTNPILNLLPGVPLIRSEGRSFPVQTYYLEQNNKAKMETSLVRKIQEAMHRHSGDILAFLPGAGEIRRVQKEMEKLNLTQNVAVYPLFGNLSREEQDAAIAPCPAGIRKVVLATSIAETSLTVEGVHIVVDSGLMRIPRFSPRTGMTRLETIPVSLDAADQRRGRAGRLGPGVCYRMWTEEDNRQLIPSKVPEIREADLATLVLELAIWGVTDPDELQWVTPPPMSSFSQARDILIQLGALDKNGKILPHGRKIAELGMHPRLAHMILRSIPLHLGELACEMAALLNERDIIHVPDADLRTRLELLQQLKRGGKEPLSVDLSACRRILADADQWQKALGIPRANNDIEACGLLLSFAFPDRIAQAKGGGRFLLLNGRGAALLTQTQSFVGSVYIVAAELDDSGMEGRILLAAPIDQSHLIEHFKDQIQKETKIAWDPVSQSVRARQRTVFEALILKEEPIHDVDPEAILSAMLEGISEKGLSSLPWTKTARQLQQRVCFLQRYDEGWPDLSDDTLLKTLSQWLGPHLYGYRRLSELQQLNMTAILEATLPWPDRQELDELAPTHIVVPSGSRIPIDYNDPQSPALSVKLQEMFGLTKTPRIMRGKIPLTMHLLSPAQRPVQVTQDLSSFWQKAYYEVKKDLKGRYPKHYWPDDPLAAIPTNRTRPKT
jgi:ATP-dependent helicase HrpB